MESLELPHEQPLYNIDEILELIKHILQDYSEEIPTHIVHGESNEKLFKIQTNWFQAVVNVLEFTKENLKFREATIPVEINNLINYLAGNEFKDQKRNKREDIIRANSALKLSETLLKKLKKK